MDHFTYTTLDQDAATHNVESANVAADATARVAAAPDGGSRDVETTAKPLASR